MADDTFTNCHCPHCKFSLDDVAIDTHACPRCRRGWEQEQVWMTRRYPGHIMLPGWLRAFGWPFLLMVGSGGLALVGYLNVAPIPMRIPALLFAVGAVYFVVKLKTDGEY